MMVDIRRAVPEYVLKELIGTHTLDRLLTNKFGITFPSDKGCQVRISRYGYKRSRYLTYSKYGGIYNTINKAMAISEMFVRELIDVNDLPPTIHRGYDNICLLKSKDKRRDHFVYQHIIWYNEAVSGKTKSLVLHHGRYIPTAGQWLHAQHTALLFKIEQHIASLSGRNADRAKYKLWKTRRLYLEDRPFVDYDAL